jgi:ribosomal protein S18 acetylase RimI-like enzyme
LQSTPDLLAALPAFRTFTRPDGTDLTLLSAASPSDLPPPTAAALFELTAQNMAPLYAASGFGWDPAAKARELRDGAARFLLAYETKDVVTNSEATTVPQQPPPLPTSATPAAFVHYRLEMEAGVGTLYVYEIQLAPAFRRRGLGRFLMLALEAAAGAAGLGQLMLTVQAGNPGAAALYEGLGFATDPSSPGPGEGPGGGGPAYRIMSKRLGGGAGQAVDGAVEVVSGVWAKAGGEVRAEDRVAV